MLIKNMRQGELVNGSLGVVVAFMTPQDAQREQTEIADVNPNVVCRPSIPRLLCLT